MSTHTQAPEMTAAGAIGLHLVEVTDTGGRFTARLVKVAALPTTSTKES